MMKKNQKSLCLSLIVLILTIGLTFTGSQKESAAADKETLEFWSWRTEDVKVYNELIAMFNKQYPDITVNFTAYKSTEWNTILSAAVKGGNPPDIVHLRAYGGLENYAAPGYLVALDDKAPRLQEFSPVARLGVTAQKDGKLYGVPFATQTLVIYYNRKIYNQLGLNEPETWEEFLSNLEQVKAAGIIPLANGGKDGWTLEVMHGVICPNFYGANEFFDAVVKGETTFTDERYQKSLEKLLELRQYMPENFMGIGYTDMQMMFINEMAAHFIGGSWEAGYFKSQNPDLDYWVYPGPAAQKGDQRYVSTFADGSYGVSSATEHLDAAVKFINFTATAEYGQYFTDTLLQLSPVPGVVPKAPFLNKVLELNQTSTSYIMLVGFRYNQPTGSALLQSALQGMMDGKITSTEVAEEVQKGIATYYEPFQK